MPFRIRCLIAFTFVAICAACYIKSVTSAFAAFSDLHDVSAVREADGRLRIKGNLFSGAKSVSAISMARDSKGKRIVISIETCRFDKAPSGSFECIVFLTHSVETVAIGSDKTIIWKREPGESE